MMGFSDKDYVERFMLAISPKFQALLDKAERRIQETGGISRDGVWAQSEDETKA
ncbi:MAG: hypothetical protein JW963_12640 [Anaerolineales bacterium]|nr:hypothetical protein [Anaerolineales bacterium]